MNYIIINLLLNSSTFEWYAPYFIIPDVVAIILIGMMIKKKLKIYVEICFLLAHYMRSMRLIGFYIQDLKAIPLLFTNQQPVTRI